MATGWHMVLGSLPLLAVSIAQEGSELGANLSQLTGRTVMSANKPLVFGNECATVTAEVRACSITAGLQPCNLSAERYPVLCMS